MLWNSNSLIQKPIFSPPLIILSNLLIFILYFKNVYYFENCICTCQRKLNINTWNQLLGDTKVSILSHTNTPKDYIRFHTTNTSSLRRALKVWLLFSGGKGTDRISITLRSACCACHVAINNSYFDLMGHLLLMDFKELLQRWIYVLLWAVYRSQDEQRHKMTYSRSFSKPGVYG